MWTKELVELLLLKYQEHNNLYNVKHPAYLDRVKRLSSLLAIWQELRNIKKDITVEDIKKKIHSLRTQYIKESHEIAKSKRIGAGKGDIYVPKLWWFPQLQFLKSYCTTRKFQSKITNRKTSRLDKQLDNVKSLLVKRYEDKSDYDWLGMQVVFVLNTIKNSKIRRDTAWEIQKILREASIKDAAINSYPSENVSSDLQTDAQACCDSSSSKKQSSCSSLISVRQQSDLMDVSASKLPVCPVRLISAKSYNNSKSYLPSPDIL